jgi:hypothetical protein
MTATLAGIELARSSAHVTECPASRRTEAIGGPEMRCGYDPARDCDPAEVDLERLGRLLFCKILDGAFPGPV